MSARGPILQIAITLVVLFVGLVGVVGAFNVIQPPGAILVAASTLPGGASAAASAPVGSTAPTPAPDASAASASVGPSTSAPAGASAPPPVTPSPSGSPSVGPPSSPPPSTPPAPSLVPAPLTGVLVAPRVASRHVIAVMIDDLWPARPQSGFAAASVVWQAPAEGGIPRYMLLFQDGVPRDVGPVRSARYYFIGWAAEWRAAYAHAGGSPQALQTLRAQGHGQLVYNVDEFAYSSSYFWRIGTRYAPHNLYTNGQRLRQMATGVGARSAATPPKPAWTFRTEAPFDRRPVGGSIQVSYLANHIRYTYDRATNTYPRWVSPGVKQVDASTGKRVAPKNVVIMFVRFGPLNDAHPDKGRLEAQFIGSGRAYVATNGRTVAARWIKTSLTAPTQFVDARGNPIALSPGQTFIQVMPVGSQVVIADGRTAPRPASAGPYARPA